METLLPTTEIKNKSKQKNNFFRNQYSLLLGVLLLVFISLSCILIVFCFYKYSYLKDLKLTNKNLNNKLEEVENYNKKISLTIDEKISIKSKLALKLQLTESVLNSFTQDHRREESEQQRLNRLFIFYIKIKGYPIDEFPGLHHA